MDELKEMLDEEAHNKKDFDFTFVLINHILIRILSIHFI
jgi:hypothetical protein